MKILLKEAITLLDGTKVDVQVVGKLPSTVRIPTIDAKDSNFFYCPTIMCDNCPYKKLGEDCADEYRKDLPRLLKDHQELLI